MTPLKFAVGLAAGLTLGLPLFAAAGAQTPPAATDAPVEPQARQALDKMGAYLRTLSAFEVDTKTSLDVVTEAGQRIQLEGTAAYKVRRPDAFRITVESDWKKRTFYYDGKQFTIFAPELGYYARAVAPATIGQTLDVISEKFGITLPLEDLFRWNDPTQRQSQTLDSAMYIGAVTIDGALTEQYAFRQGMMDWQVWIQTGDQPLPRKLVIIDRTDPAQPAYTARMAWRLNPTLTNADFTFTPAQDAKAIRLTTVEIGR
jgi:hypothetical protein